MQPVCLYPATPQRTAVWFHISMHGLVWTLGRNRACMHGSPIMTDTCGLSTQGRKGNSTCKRTRSADIGNWWSGPLDKGPRQDRHHRGQAQAAENRRDDERSDPSFKPPTSLRIECPAQSRLRPENTSKNLSHSNSWRSSSSMDVAIPSDDHTCTTDRTSHVPSPPFGTVNGAPWQRTHLEMQLNECQQTQGAASRSDGMLVSIRPHPGTSSTFTGEFHPSQLATAHGQRHHSLPDGPSVGLTSRPLSSASVSEREEVHALAATAPWKAVRQHAVDRPCAMLHSERTRLHPAAALMMRRNTRASHSQLPDWQASGRTSVALIDRTADQMQRRHDTAAAADAEMPCLKTDRQDAAILPDLVREWTQRTAQLELLRHVRNSDPATPMATSLQSLQPGLHRR